MISPTNEYLVLRSNIETFGSKGKIHHITTHSGNSYNEDGEEIEEVEEDNVIVTEVFYSTKKIYTKEQSPISLEDSFIRFTIPYIEDIEISKKDLFEDTNGIKYPIEQIDYLGDRTGFVLVQLYCKQD